MFQCLSSHSLSVDCIRSIVAHILLTLSGMRFCRGFLCRKYDSYCMILIDDLIAVRYFVVIFWEVLLFHACFYFGLADIFLV